MRPSNVVLYQTPWCWYCMRVRAKLEELDLEYRIVNVPDFPWQRAIVKEISGQSSVPVMVDGEVVLDDDDRIIPYLEKKYGA